MVTQVIFDTLAPVTQGQVGTAPTLFTGTTDQTLAVITTAGAVADLVSQGIFKVRDILFVNYDVDGTPAVDEFEITSTSSGSLIPLGGLTSLADGSVSAPSLNFRSSPNTGLFYGGSNSIGIAANGVGVMALAATQVTMSVQFAGLLTATAAAPGICTASNDLDTGIYPFSVNVLGIAAGGTAAVTVSSTVLNMLTGVTLRAAGTQVVSTRKTGWTIMTGTPQRGTFATGSVTLPQLAGVVMALQQDLGITASGHGLIDA